MSGTKGRVWGAVAVALVVAFSVGAMTATEAIKQRQEEMEGVYSSMKTFAAIAKKEQPFDAEVVQDAAAKMADHLAKAQELFPEGSLEGEAQSWAKPEIWSEKEKFDEIFASTHQAAVDMQSVKSMEEFPPALGKIGSGCKSCHNLYRLPKD